MESAKKSVYILAAGSLWGMMGLFVRSLAQFDFSSVEISVIRSVGASIILGVFLLVKDKSKLCIKLKDIWVFVGTGVVSLTFFNICYFTTIQRTSMAVAAILLYTSPVFVVLLSGLLFKEKITPLKIVALIVALIGVALVTGVISFLDESVAGGIAEGFGNITGVTILIGIGSGIGYALYSVFGRYALMKKYSSETISFYTFLFSSIGLILCALIFGTMPELAAKFVSRDNLTGEVISGETMTIALLCIGIAVVVTILPYLLYTKGLSGVENGKAGIMASIEPVVAAILGMLVYSEVLSVSGYVGIALVLGAIVLLNIDTK